ncbi:histidinol dehydrogenase [Arthrobacter roseus]|uniref:histidinol dehydrogenase n=1 Tax=Arthrobacter roseus TaxID=136274 RepID=UPI003B839188|nr:histidinol dehydrogenase [Arthrobacter roseus]
MTSADLTQPNPQFQQIDLRGQHRGMAALKKAMPRAIVSSEHATDAVASIIADVRARGLPALTELAERFDGVVQDSPVVPAHALSEALESLDPSIRAGLEESIRRARVFADAQMPADASVAFGAGATVRSKWVPVARVGLYVPGGLAVYPSSVVMNVVPAQVAGVDSIALASPPQKEFGGLPHPVILAAAALLGIEEVYAIGGAQAIAAFAYGIPGEGLEADSLLAPVDVVTGPGNIYVATAKRLVQGVVGIDAEAGTTEIVVLADDSADAGLVAADLISQAEHDPHAASVLVTPSTRLAGEVSEELLTRTALTRHRERVTEALSGPQSGVILVDDVAHGIDVCNAYAAEHLEIHTVDAAADAERIRHAGAVFVGQSSPVSLGDYCAGSNHVLPTAGTAAFASGLNVTSFLKAMQIVNYSKAALLEVAAHVENLSEAENLPAHGDAIRARRDR